MGYPHARRTWVRDQASFAGVALAHAAILALLVVALKPVTAMAPANITIAPVYLTRLAPRPEAPPKRTVAPAPPRVLSRPTAVAETPVAPVPAPPAEVPAARPDDGADRQALSRVLRTSRAGCATPTLLTAEERARCDARLADGAKTAAYIPTPLPPERRAFYDAVAQAKQPFSAGNITKTAGKKGFNARASGLAGLLAEEADGARAMGGHAAGVGCAITFGGRGGGVKKPPHGLKLGPLPCFVVPPQGPLTVEADIQNPDTVMKASK